jgi:Predicted membrane protein (DUF2177)
LACRLASSAHSEGASRQRVAPPSGRSPGLASSSTKRPITGAAALAAACSASWSESRKSSRNQTMIGGAGGSVIRRDNSKAGHQVLHGTRCNLVGADAYLNAVRSEKGWRAVVKRHVALYLATLLVLTVLDFLFLGILAKGFFVAQVGDMLGEVRLVPAVLFYLLYVAGALTFVSADARGAHSTLLYGALFGLTATRRSISPRLRWSGIGAGQSRWSMCPGARW